MAKKVINRVYPNAEEKLVKNTIVYYVYGTLYYDEAREHRVDATDLKNLFFKGLIVCDEGINYIPISLESNDGSVTVHAIKLGDGGEIKYSNYTAPYYQN